MTLLGKGVGSSGQGWVTLTPGDRLGGGKSLPKFLTPLVVDVFHFPEFLQRVSGKLGTS